MSNQERATPMGEFVKLGAPDERQGRYLRTDATHWYCGDEWCDCHQAVVTRWYTHNLCAGITWPVMIWHGDFHTGMGEDDANGSAEAAMPEARRIAAADDGTREWLASSFGDTSLGALEKAP